MWLQEHTQSILKPLVEIGGARFCGHLMEIYAALRFPRGVIQAPGDGHGTTVPSRATLLRSGRGAASSASVTGAR